MNGEVVDPDHEDGEVDGEDAEHEDEDGVGVVVEIMMGPRTLLILRILHLCTLIRQEKLTVSRPNLNARVQVASCTMQASKYAN